MGPVTSLVAGAPDDVEVPGGRRHVGGQVHSERHRQSVVGPGRRRRVGLGTVRQGEHFIYFTYIPKISSSVIACIN